MSGQEEMTMNDQPFNNWKLRAAAANVRSKLQIARLGSFGGVICAFLAYQFDQGQYAGAAPPWVSVALYVACVVVPTLLLIPALRVKCPKCEGRYCNFSGIFRKMGDMPPCASCGFDVEGYIPRYR
jgi:hypothetical protein